MNFYRQNKFGVIISGIVALFICLGLNLQLQQNNFNASILWSGLGSLFLTIFLYFILGTTDLNHRILEWTKDHKIRSLLIPLPLLINYLIYFFGTGENQPHHIAYVFLFLWLPVLCMMAAPVGSQKLTWSDLAFVVVIWAPIDAAIIQNAWHWPLGHGSSAYVTSTATCITIMLMIGVRGLDGVRYKFAIQKQDWKIMSLNLNLATVCIIPAGLLVGFVRWSPQEFEITQFLSLFVGLLLMVAIPEEIFFRGFLQNLLQKSMKNQRLALIIASIIFGFAHINNEAFPGGPVPDIRYVFFGSIAGYFYGRTWLKCGVFPAAIIHAVMDTIWIQFLRGNPASDVCQWC
ncbi:MAG: hypothetical protein CMP10_01270 [Zetaproteobacteria bacterium]|nr:hypothetical protein [Pseudobdellovibrionaceae bacterium]